MAGLLRWTFHESKGLPDAQVNLKGIIDASCITCHTGPTPDGSYLMTSHDEIRGVGSDATPNAIPGSNASLVVQKMIQRHSWQSLNADSVAAAVLADSISSWIVDDYMREY